MKRAQGKEDTVRASDNEAQTDVALVPLVKMFATLNTCLFFNSNIHSGSVSLSLIIHFIIESAKKWVLPAIHRNMVN
ncbi:hypothetical protein ACE1TH_07715 [Shouchella sp. JSM 1781072]|uniref:hypothetical protein n=1 Tax=Bacillaceae TaxID=186817 RepID=UPI0020D13E90|nr:hypothetical protein [Alkalihalobacillus sp. LMS6]UTR08004.1 hypothetical protein MM326_08330 [Alkalihalobacillus sp. LMS6]